MKLRYPLDAQNGRLVTESNYPEKVRQSIISAVMTYNRERVMRENYGLNLRPFDSLRVPDLLQDIRRAITVGLVGYEGVRFELSGSLDQGSLQTLITFWVNSSQFQTTLSLPL